ncbi:MAG: peptide chain release factor N(5)-glutamine methyltransferase [Thermodesulfobacteriota bacterium]
MLIFEIMQLRELYNKGKNLLEQAMVPEPAIEASSLLANAAGLDKITIYSSPEMKIDENSVLKFNEFITRRINGEPNSYITGNKEFYSKNFIVNHDVLIPRPETELIVEEALKIIPDNVEYIVADTCTGSGCIGITIKSIKENIKLISADIAFPATLVGSKNSKINLADFGSLFVNTSFFECIKDRSVDMVVCNPPYIANGDYNNLQEEVRNHEPKQALVSGEDGLAHIKEIVYGSKMKLKNGGWLIIEIGKGQGRQTVEFFKRCGFGQIDVVLDVNKIERVIKGQWKES